MYPTDYTWETVINSSVIHVTHQHGHNDAATTQKALSLGFLLGFYAMLR